jgi:hypothetical protein
MNPVLKSVSLSSLLAFSVTGCSFLLLAPAKPSAQTSVSMSLEDLKEFESVVTGKNVSAAAPVLRTIPVGRHLQLLTSSDPKTDVRNLPGTLVKLAGTVIQNSEDSLTLQDAVIIRDENTVTGTPIISRLPHFERLFRNAGSRTVASAVPGEVTIEYSSILTARELDADAFLEVRTSGSVRRGVDYDSAGQ